MNVNAPIRPSQGPAVAPEGDFSSPQAKTARALPEGRWEWLAACAASLFWIGLLVRLTIADRFEGANTLFYALPWSILAALAVTVACCERRRPQKRRRWLIGGLLCGIVWLYGAWYARAGVTTEPTVRVVLWNMAHGKRGFSGAAAALAEMKPDIAILIEADPKKGKIRETLQEHFPDHKVSLLGAGIVLVSRWSSGVSTPYQVGDEERECRIREIDIETPLGEWTLFGVDFGSSPFYDRGPAYEDLARYIARRNDRPVIVAGDFNTPLDSVHYQRFRDLGLREAFETAGTGYKPTWPLPLPVLSLDQIWVSDQIQPVNANREWSIRSDHAAVIGILK